MKYPQNLDGGNLVPKFTTVGHSGADVPAHSVLGKYCTITSNTLVGSGTVVGDGARVHGGCRFGDGVIFKGETLMAGTTKNPITFGEGTTIAAHSELRHVHFKRGLRVGRDVTLVSCVLPSDTQFEDRTTVATRGCKRLKVDEPYQWPDEVTAEPDRHRVKERKETPAERKSRRIQEDRDWEIHIAKMEAAQRLGPERMAEIEKELAELHASDDQIDWATIT